MTTDPRGRHVLLIGMRGCGKTTVGRALAERLDRPFTDLDDVLADLAGCDADRLLAERGEAEFRAFERRALEQAARLPPGVVATGGGAVLHGAAFARLAARSIVVYLAADAALLAERSRRRPRPPLRPGGPEREAAALLAERRRLYEEAAQITVPAGDPDPLQSILAELGLP